MYKANELPTENKLSPAAQAAQTIGSVKKERDPRLDFFRGVAMLIIFVAHVPGNFWAKFIPARFGPSDAAEMFVFCSGFAAAIAFGGTFRRSGFLMGTMRIVIRCVQLYVAHLGLFFVLATVCAVATAYFVDFNYIGKLNLTYFFNNTPEALGALFTLTYVPNFFDIMPMYIGVLALVPVVILLARVHPYLVPVFSIALYAASWQLQLEFPAEPFSDRPWFFNPLTWQLLFFTGFAISAGWIKAPPPNKWLLIACIIFVLALVPISNWPIMRAIPELKEIRTELILGFKKTNFGLLRWLHFLALAYICVTLLKGREQILRHRYFKPLIKCGQQALPVFLLGMTLSWIGGIVLDQIGREALGLTIVNLSGMSILIGYAYLMGWVKSSPWRQASNKPTQTEAKPETDLNRTVAQPAE
ncbi:OpgC family protein [uncultured Kiloniella sp.]|uniref:OpgC family protein n=1 Tax=uncultured Kiloniella sp. TaxID=1133091 RepID=UPI00260ACA4E|nr:OpgC domain-containing protein [uncultured Kiloniella sp.]